MSAEEDIELRDLVSQALETNGVLPKIKAELRSNVFLALEENSNNKPFLYNEQLTNLAKAENGALVLNLIREFLEFYELEFTLAVFNPETKYGLDYHGEVREKLLEQINIKENDINRDKPLLVDIINSLRKNIKSRPASNVVQSSVTVEKLTSPQLNSTYTLGQEEPATTPTSSKADDSNRSVEEDVLSGKSSELDESQESTTPQAEDETVKPTADDPLSPFKTGPVTPKKQTINEMKDDLLLFTPDSKSVVKQTKSSILGDLPPLNFTGELSKDKTNKIDEIKALMDTGLSVESIEDDNMSSVNSKESKDIQKVDESVKSEKSESVGEEFDEDVSELLFSQASSEGVMTADETISRTSNVGDYMESV